MAKYKEWYLYWFLLQVELRYAQEATERCAAALGLKVPLVAAPRGHDERPNVSVRKAARACGATSGLQNGSA